MFFSQKSIKKGLTNQPFYHNIKLFKFMKISILHRFQKFVAPTGLEPVFKV